MPSVEESLAAILEMAMSGQFPQRLQALLTAIPQLQGLASGSSAAILPRVSPQMGQLAQTLVALNRSLSQQLGPSGGGQLGGEMQRALDAITTQAGQLFAGAAGQGQEALQKLSGASLISPRLSSPERTASKPGAFNSQAFAGSLTGLFGKGGLIQQLMSVWPSSGSGFGGAGPTTLEPDF